MNQHAASYLGRIAARAPASPEELAALKASAWQASGLLVVNPYDPNEPMDDFLRQALKNLGAKRHGRRMRK